MKLALAKQYGLNPFQFLALMLVGTSKGLSIRELRHRLSIPGSSLTFTIDSLETKGLIKRQRSRLDRRQWLISLSAKGKRLYEEILAAESQAISPALERLSEMEKEILLKLAEEITWSGTQNQTRKDQSRPRK